MFRTIKTRPNKITILGGTVLFFCLFLTLSFAENINSSTSTSQVSSGDVKGRYRTYTPQPDLAVEDIKFYQPYSFELPEDQITPQIGQAVTCKAILKNIGVRQTDVFNVKWFVDDRLQAYDSHSSLSPQATSGEKVRFNWIPTEGKHTLKFVADCDEQTKDLNRANNTFTKQVLILDTSPPEIIITSPKEGEIIIEPEVTLKGTVDSVAFSETRTLSIIGENTLTKTAADRDGNTASASVTVYYYPGELIGPEGGEVSSPDAKIKVVIPEGALTEPTLIKILAADTQDLPTGPPSGAASLTMAECLPYGLEFSKPVTLTYILNQAEVPGTPIELAFYDPAQRRIISTGQTSSIFKDGYTLTFSITQLSTYVVLKNFVTPTRPIGGGVKIPLPDMFTGAFSHSVPLTIPPGRKGMQPSLALTYRSSNSNSWTGVGFSLNPGYIVRSTKLGPPTYNDTQDDFYLVTDGGTTELTHLIDNLYQAKIESGFTKFFKEDDTWRVLNKDGSLLLLGQTPNSKETSSFGTFSWHLTKAIDTNGNYIQYHYSKDQGKSYLARIDYTGNEAGLSPTNTLEFFLESRTDIPSSYISTSKVSTARRLKEIQAKANSELVWRYELEYTYSPDTHRSILTSITQYASDDESLPAQRFGYQEAR